MVEGKCVLCPTIPGESFIRPARTRIAFPKSDPPDGVTVCYQCFGKANAFHRDLVQGKKTTADLPKDQPKFTAVVRRLFAESNNGVHVERFPITVELTAQEMFEVRRLQTMLGKASEADLLKTLLMTALNSSGHLPHKPA